MKRSGFLKRTTPLKTKTSLKTKTQLKTHKPLNTQSVLKNKTPLKVRSVLKSTTSLKSNGSIKSKISVNSTVKKRYGLVGKGRSVSDVSFHGRLVASGCFSCNYQGVDTPFTLRVHHPRGRNKGKGDVSEKIALCLCDQCHDPGAALLPDKLRTLLDIDAPSVHGNKKAFKEQIGSEAWCVLESYKALKENPVWLNQNEWGHYLSLTEKSSQEFFANESLTIRRAA